MMMAMILLPAATALQNTITRVDVKGRNPFSVLIIFLCKRMQVLKLHKVVRIINVDPFIPRALACSNNTSRKDFIFSDDISFEEFEIKLIEYAKNNPYPNIDD